MMRIALLLWLFGTGVVQALPPPQVHWVKITPDRLFTGEEKSLLITAAVSTPEPMTVALLHLTPDRTRIAHRWEMTDDGTFGDAQANDGIYSRKVEFNPYRPTPIVFAVRPEYGIHRIAPGDSVPDDVQAAHIASVTVAAQPTFVEVLRRIWRKIFSSGETL